MKVNVGLGECPRLTFDPTALEECFGWNSNPAVFFWPRVRLHACCPLLISEPFPHLDCHVEESCHLVLPLPLSGTMHEIEGGYPTRAGLGDRRYPCESVVPRINANVPLQIPTLPSTELLPLGLLLRSGFLGMHLARLTLTFPA